MHVNLTERTDTIIIGCGIAGGMLASYLAEAGLKTIVLEKRPQIGVPIRCAEAAGSRQELSHFLTIDEGWISANIDAVKLESPGGTVLERAMPGIGVVLKRDRFDQALAERAARAGADIRTHVEARELEYSGDTVTGVRCFDHAAGRTRRIAASLIVGADGVESTTARLAGLRRHLKPAEIHSCCQYLMADDGFPGSTITLIAGKQRAPGGYIWIFPRGEGYANVGVGVHPGMTNGLTARNYLDAFVAARYPAATTIATIAGGTSGVKPLKTIVANGLLLVGEGAGHNNPFSGGGIMNALEGAEEAAAVIIRCFREGDFSRSSLCEYERRWEIRNGRTIAKFASLRKFFYTLEDSDIDTIITLLERHYPAGGTTRIDYTELFKNAILSAPGLLWKARKLLW